VTALSRSRSSLLTPVSPYFLDSAFPSESDLGFDQHSSEEELETINSSATGQEKRKWSEVTPERATGSPRRWLGSGEGCGWVSRAGSSGCSSDEEVWGVEACMSTPVQFRTSPPRGTLRPTTSAPSALQPDASPRKRHRLAPPPRPSLNFEKMQQTINPMWKNCRNMQLVQNFVLINGSVSSMMGFDY